MFLEKGKKLQQDGIMKFIFKKCPLNLILKIIDLSLKQIKSFGHAIITLKLSLVAEGIYVLILGGIYQN